MFHFILIVTISYGIIVLNVCIFYSYFIVFINVEYPFCVYAKAEQFYTKSHKTKTMIQMLVKNKNCIKTKSKLFIQSIRNLHIYVCLILIIYL